MAEFPLHIHRCPNCGALLKKSHIKNGHCWKCEHRFGHVIINEGSDGIHAKNESNNKIDNDKGDKRNYSIFKIILGIALVIFWMIISYPDMDWELKDSDSKKSFVLGCLQGILILLFMYLWKKIKILFSFINSSIKKILNKKNNNSEIEKNYEIGHISNRLKELKSLYEDNLINEVDYIKKKEDLLKEL